MLRGALAVGLATGVLVLAGCSVEISGDDSTDQTTADAAATLESMIRTQLPSKLSQQGQLVTVQQVGCVQESETSYTCTASVRDASTPGASATYNLPIQGTCDERQCIWQVSAR